VTERIISTRDLAELSGNELLSDIESARVVYLGEKHDDSRHHELQREVLESMIERGRKPAIGFETFSIDQTSALMDYATGGGASGDDDAMEAEERLRHRLGWTSSQDETWSWYLPLLRLARSHSLPVFGADLPRPLRARISRLGVEGLSSVEKLLLFPTDFQDTAYEKAMHERIKAAHCGWGSPDYLARMYETWLARNDSMSMAIEATLRDQPNQPVVMILGGGHTLSDMGVYERVAHRLPGVPQSNIGFRRSTPEAPAISWQMRMSEAGDAQQQPDHQYIWFTRPIDPPVRDPCEAFLQSRTDATDTSEAEEAK